MSVARLLTLNAGSSSLKFAVYEAGPGLPLRLSGQVSGLGETPRLRARLDGQPLADESWTGPAGLDAVLDRTLIWLADAGWSEGLAAVGHRIVHGGLEFRGPAELTAAVLQRLEALAPLAPLHQPFNLRGVARAAERFPEARQIGVFDTAFHAGQAEVARLYALPRDLIAEGVLAYGFHGLSYDYIAGVLRAQDGPRAGGGPSSSTSAAACRSAPSPKAAVSPPPWASRPSTARRCPRAAGRWTRASSSI